MTHLPKSYLEEITYFLILANTPRSLFRALLSSQAVDLLQRECTVEELLHYYNTVTLKPSKSPLVTALSYAVLIALLLKQPTPEQSPDLTCLHWGGRNRFYYERFIRINSKFDYHSRTSGQAKISKLSKPSRSVCQQQITYYHKLMKAKLALVAKSIILAHDTQVPSAITIMEGIHAEGFPLYVPEISFLTVWQLEEGDSKEHKGILTVTLDGEELVKHDVTVAFRDRQVARNISTFQGLVIPKPGSLEFKQDYSGVTAAYVVTVTAISKVESTQ